MSFKSLCPANPVERIELKLPFDFGEKQKIREVYAIVPLDILLVEQKTEQQHRETVTFTWQKKNGTAALSVFYINDPSLQWPCIIKVLSSFFPLCVFVYVGV